MSRHLLLSAISLFLLLACSEKPHKQDDIAARIENAYSKARKQIINQDYATALCSLLNAEKMAEEADNPYVSGTIHREMAHLFNLLGAPQHELLKAEEAYRDFFITRDTVLIQLASIDLVRAAGNNSEKEFLFYRHLADSLFKQTHGNDMISLYLKTEALRSKSHAIFSLKKEMTLPYMDQSEELLNSLPEDFFKPDSVNNMSSWIGFLPGKSGSLLECLSPERAKELYHELSARGVTLTATETAHTADFINDSIDVDKIISNHAAASDSIQRSKQKRALARWAILSITLIVAVIILCAVIIARERKRSKDRRQFVKEASNLHDLLLSKERHIDGLEEYLNTLFHEKFIMLEELCDLFIMPNKSRSEQNHIYTNVKSIVEGFKMDGKRMAEIGDYVNRYKNNIVDDFNHDFPQLKESDRFLFVYLSAGFSRQAISYFIDESVEVISNRKLRLKNKIRNSDVADKNRYLDIF